VRAAGHRQLEEEPMPTLYTDAAESLAGALADGMTLAV
jgi:hypothetical protein